jgi:hypothetical protein
VNYNGRRQSRGSAEYADANLGIIALALVVIAVSCQRPERELAAEKSCGLTSSTQLTGDSLGGLRIGATDEEIAKSCRVVRDENVPAEGMAERVLSIQLANDTVQATMVAGKVWRLRVAAPRFRTSDSTGVGSTVRDLRRRDGFATGRGESGFYAIYRSACGLSFHLDFVDPTPGPSSSAPDSAVVDYVLLVGCNGSH